MFSASTLIGVGLPVGLWAIFGLGVASAQVGEPSARPASSQAAPATASGEEAPRTWYGDHDVALDKARWRPGKGLRFESVDGLHSLELRLRAQFLYTVSRPYDAADDRHGALRQGMQIRRARLQFGGEMWGPDVEYKVELALAPSDLGMEGGDDPPITNGTHTVSRSPLLDWYVDFTRLRDLNVRVGQSKVPFSRERVISSGNLQFVDRTILNGEFNLDRDIGVDVRSQDLFGLDEKLRYYLGVYNGKGHSYYKQDDFGLMYLARLEVLPLGDFDDYSHGDFARGRSPGLSVGVAYARIQGARGSRGILGQTFEDGGTTNYDNVSADLTFKYQGLSLESVYFFRDGTRFGGGAVDDAGAPILVAPARNGWGAGAQLGYLVPAIDLELAARYGAIRAADRASSLSDSNETGLSLSYYVARHAQKIQADYLRLWGPGAGGAGAALADGADLIRVQLQASF